LSIEHPEIEVDFERVLVQGDSAGSWCALQSIMTQPRGTFKACFLQYLVVCAFPTSTDDRLMGQEIPPKEALDEFLASITQGTVMSSVTPPARKWVAPMLRAHGLWKHYFGDGRYIMPDTAIEDVKSWVPTFIVHGRDDSVVPVKWTELFVQKIKRKFSDVEMELVTPPGDHGFDGEMYGDEEG
jgi:pimeloyl-ACP methyl ester carboxylesterase